MRQKREAGQKRAFYLSRELNDRLDKASKLHKLSGIAEQALDRELRGMGL